jgi:hypothetical protein
MWPGSSVGVWRCSFHYSFSCRWCTMCCLLSVSPASVVYLFPRLHSVEFIPILCGFISLFNWSRVVTFPELLVNTMCMLVTNHFRWYTDRQTWCVCACCCDSNEFNHWFVNPNLMKVWWTRISNQSAACELHPWAIACFYAEKLFSNEWQSLSSGMVNLFLEAGNWF